MQALQGQGLSLTQIAEALTGAGLRTQQGKTWTKQTVGWFLRHYGR
jgi:hypothetical protein